MSVPVRDGQGIKLKYATFHLFICTKYLLNPKINHPIVIVVGHFTVIEPSKFQNKTMKSSNINALFCHTNTKMPENYNFQILVHCYPIIN